LSAALQATHIVGLHTNVAFLRRVVGSQAFATADLDTALIEREHAALFEAAPLAADVAAAGVAVHKLAADAALQGADPWSRRDGWRLHGAAQRRLDLVLQGQPLLAVLQRLHDGATLLQLGHGDAATRQVLLWRAQPARGPDSFDVQLGEQRHTLTVYAQGERYAVFAAEGSALLTENDPLAHAGDAAGAEGRLTAPMPGKVVSFLAQAGDTVKRGQPLAVMEAMKMEHTISAPHDGVVQELMYAVGDQVAEGGELLRLAKG
jgi:3-methylcrotonyl-CoA carboxylase alpha subunit